MRKQQSGMPPYPGQHPISNEMQLWQQHLMYKQLQELQRQQQPQQLDQGARQQNLLSQAASRQAVANQLPSFLNGMPINGASSYMLPNDIMHGESKTPSSTQMFTANNTNWAQGRGSPGLHGSSGIMYHGQAMSQAGFVPQQLDQSLYGTPISRSLLNQHTQFQGLPNTFSDVMAKAVRDQLEQASVHSVQSNSFQKDQCGLEQAGLQDGLSVAAEGFQGKSLFLNAPVQSSSDGTTSGNFQPVNHPQHSIQAQVFQNGQEQAGWSMNLEEKTATQAGPSRGVTSLDPTEEKILFGTDDDGNWGSSFGNIMGTGETFESTEQFGAFPSLHSGSWSALMQEAVQASSSDKGFQEEWSGLNFQKTEPSVGNSSAMHYDNPKHQATWDRSNNFQSVSSSSLSPSTLFNDANSGPPFSTAPSLLHSSGIVYEENNRVQNDISHESFQQSSKEERNMHLDQVHKKKPILDSGLQVQIQSNDVHGVWSKRMYEQSIKSADSTNAEFNLQNNLGTWTHQENMPLSNINRQPDISLTGWNKSLTTHGGRSSEGADNNRTLYAQNGGNLSSGMGPVKSDIGSSQIQSAAFSPSDFAAVVISNNLNANQETKQHAINRYQADLGKRAAFDSFVKPRGENVEEYKHQPSKAQQIQESSVNSADPSPSMSDSQTSSGMSGWKTVGLRRFQSQSIENLGMNVERADSPKDTAYSQSLPKSAIQQLKNQEQGYVENSQFVGHGASNRGKGYSTDTQRSIGSPEESQYRSTLRNRKTSQNMLELLQKADNSRDNTTVACFGNSDLSTVHDTHEAGSADGSVSHPRHHQSSPFQGFGLRLASPSQQEVPNHYLQSQTPSSHDFNRRQVDSEAGDKDRMQSACIGSGRSLNHAHEASHKENLEGRSDFSGEKCKEMPQLIAQGNSPVVTASNPSYMGRQLQLQKQQQLLQQQQHFLRQRQLQLQKQQLLQQQQASLPTMAGRILPFRLDSSADALGSGSQINSPGIGHSQPTNPMSYHLNSAQQLPLGENGSILQARARSGMFQQSGFSSMLHNVRMNTSVQQVLSGGQPQKLIPSLPQSASSRDKNSEAVQMEGDQCNKGGSVPPELGTCSNNSQQFTDADKNQVEENSLQGTDSERGEGTPKRGSGLEEQELMPKHHSDSDSAVSISSLGYLPHYDANRVKQQLNIAASNNDVGLYGLTVLPSNVQQPNYSLLQQIQAMKSADSDANRTDVKRLKGEFGPDVSHTEWQAVQEYSYGQNAVSRVPQADELGASSQSSFYSDVKMLSFSSRENEGINAEKPAELADREGLSQNTCLPGQLDLQNQSQPHTSHLIGRNEHPSFTPQMARSLFEQYSKYKNGQILSMYADRQSAKASSQQFLPAEVSARINNTAVAEQRIETSPFAAVSQIMSTSHRAANELSRQLPIGITSNDVVIRSKKRKTATSEFLPWHEVVSPCVQRLQSISMAERDWAQAANRLTEKVEDAAEMIKDGPLVPRARRRLILTTQLMQQALPSIPASILAAEVTSAHGSVTYFLAKSTLGDACSLISCSGSDSGECLNNENRTLEKPKTSEKDGEVFSAKVVEGFIGRSRKLETEFSRLDRRTSLLDVRLEWQEVERFSLINRLGKFHGRNQADGADNSSTSQTALRKIFPQRYVTAFSMPGNVPEGVLCLSL